MTIGHERTSEYAEILENMRFKNALNCCLLTDRIDMVNRYGVCGLYKCYMYFSGASIFNFNTFRN